MATVTVSINRKKHRKLPDSIEGPRNVKVGVIKGKADQDNINKAIWNEFGTKGGASGGGWGGPIPERPFLRNAIKNNEHSYKIAIGKGAAAILRGETSTEAVLDKLGQKAMQDVRKEISSLKDPPNSPVTIARKGSSKPLIDTGEMRNAVSYEVKK